MTILIGHLAKELNIDRKTAIKWAKNNNCLLETKNRKKGMGGGQHAFAVEDGDAEKMRTFFETPPVYTDDLETDELGGVFYFIKTVPDLDENRIKLGFTEDIKQRTAIFRTTIPTLELVKTWPCLRTWEIAAIASVTRTGCEFIGREVIQCENYINTMEKCNEFFSIMPNLKKPIKQ